MTFPFMHLILRALLIRRHSEQGFAIPMALMMGLIMVLLATVSIVKSNEEDLIATTQRQTAQALSAAEAGVARYRELINKNRNLAIYKSGSWNSLPTNKPICDDKSDSSTSLYKAINGGWEDVSSSDPSLGEFKLISYEYWGDHDNDDSTPIQAVADNTPPDGETVGILTVEGKVNEAIARIKAEIPVRPEDPTRSFQPALWLGSSPTNIGNNTKVSGTGNILVTDSSNLGCDTPSSPTSANLSNTSEQLIIADPRPLPPIPSPPVGAVIDISNADLNSEPKLPRNTDSPDGNNVYHYRVTNNLVFNNKSLSIDSGTRVIIYVQGNRIDFSDDVEVNKGNPSAYLEIYGSVDTTSIRFIENGTIDVNAFIHAPNATVSVNNNPTVNINGTMWVDNWDDSSTNNITITPDTTNGNPSYAYYSSVQTSDVKPEVYPPTSWETVEAN